MPFNVAVIGYGLGGRVFHAPYVSAVEGLRLAAIVSSRKEEIAQAYPGLPVYNDPALIWADPGIDVVVISTPNASHAALATVALKAGKHVVIDKPFAETVEDAHALMELAKAETKDRILTVFHNRRWDGDFLTLKRLLREGVLGDLTYVESHFDLYRPNVSTRWRETPGPSAGAWYDLGSHLLDQALNLFGIPDAIAADLSILRDGGTTTDYFRVVLKYGQQRVMLVGNYLARSDQRWIVHGSRASYIKRGLDPQQTMLVGGSSIGDVGFGVDPNPGYLVLPDGREVPVIAEKGDYRAFYENLRDCLKGIAPLAVPAREGFLVMKLLALAEKASREKREILLTPGFP
ncbi:oxidoreductase [Rhizomicrobium palustre]|nr:oxidoreductase [Rhizomicrobium palustre]